MVSFSRVLVSACAFSSWAGLGAANPIIPRGGGGDIALALIGIVKNILSATQSGTQEQTVVTYVSCISHSGKNYK